jgi:hypothetical protein
MELGRWFVRCKTNRPDLKVIKVECAYFILFILVCKLSYMKAHPYSVYFMSRGPIDNVLMQLSYEPLWTICVVYLRPIK